MRTPGYYLELAQTSDDASVLRRLADSEYPFVWCALAANPRTPPAALLRLSATRDSTWNDYRLLSLLARHPRSDFTTLQAVLTVTATKLAEGGRPYAAVLALADRVELDARQVEPLGRLPGASRRLRSGLRRRLSSRAQRPATKA